MLGSFSGAPVPLQLIQTSRRYTSAVGVERAGFHSFARIYRVKIEKLGEGTCNYPSLVEMRCRIARRREYEDELLYRRRGPEQVAYYAVFFRSKNGSVGDAYGLSGG